MGCNTCRSSCDDCSDNGLSFRVRAPKIAAQGVSAMAISSPVRMRPAKLHGHANANAQAPAPGQALGALDKSTVCPAVFTQEAHA